MITYYNMKMFPSYQYCQLVPEFDTFVTSDGAFFLNGVPISLLTNWEADELFCVTIQPQKHVCIKELTLVSNYSESKKKSYKGPISLVVIPYHIKVSAQYRGISNTSLCNNWLVSLHNIWCIFSLFFPFNN